MKTPIGIYLDYVRTIYASPEGELLFITGLDDGPEWHSRWCGILFLLEEE